MPGIYIALQVVLFQTNRMELFSFQIQVKGGRLFSPDKVPQSKR